ncbi:MAG TPA: FtsW/RodA/SpoVE family cell cycle protein [Thermomicrobiales bacterium]|nr:FtsW/RodA/SpoVE family cell cycle protein [Thermomicrobiales bacterium]
MARAGVAAHQRGQREHGRGEAGRRGGVRGALRRFRLTEFQLLIVPSLLVVVGLLTIVLVPRGDTAFTWRDIWVSFAFIGILFGLNAWFSAMGFRGDQLVLPLVATLAGLGLIVIQRLQPALRDQPGLGHIAERQLIYLALGFALLWCVVALFHQLHLVRRYKYLVGLTAIGLMALTMLVGTTIYGAKLWIEVGPVQFQPSEIVKILLVLFMAAYLDDKRELIASDYKLGPFRLPPVPYLLPLGLMYGLSLAILIVQNDFGSALLYFSIFLVMLYVASGRLLYVVAGLAAFAAGGYAVYHVSAHVAARVVVWLNPWSAPQTTGFQLIQSQYALATGGLFGTGLGYGSPAFVPVVQTDFVFAAIGEELGLLGTLAVLALYLLLTYRGLYIALRAADGFARLVAVGLTTILGIQALIIIGGVTRLIPLTGITLPFISYGGSSLVTNFILVGLLLYISDPRRGALR